MKINIFGGTGQLGSRIIDELLRIGAQPEQLIVSCRDSAKARRFTELGIETRLAEYDRPETLEPALAGSDVLMLIPGKSKVEHRIGQHDRILAAAASASVGRIVLSSLSAARTDSRFLVAPYLVYAESKTRLSGMDWTILRNGMYLDPLAASAPALAKSGRLANPVRRGRVAYVSRDDLARANAAVLIQAGHSEKVYELTGPEAWSMPQVASALTVATGTNIDFDHISEAEFVAARRKSGAPAWIAEALASMYRAVDHGEFEQVSDHVELLTGTPAESVDTYFQHAI